MEYLKCVRCGLEVRPRPARAQIENCPRCLAHGATLSPMVSAERDMAATARRAGTSRRASQGVLANAIREMRSHGRARPAR